MVSTTATTPASTARPTGHRLAERLHGYRWAITAAVLAAAIFCVAAYYGGGLFWFEAGMAVALAFTAWTSTRHARREAREVAALRAEYERTTH